MLETIFKRRSIRKYLDKPVTDEQLHTLLRAAMYAPSAANRQPWHFVVVRDRAVIEGFMQVQPYSKMLAQAPVLIVVCGDKELCAPPDYYLHDCGAATENLLLAACEMGLGTCWLGLTPGRERAEGVRKLLGLPANIEAFCGIALGWPDETREVPERYDETRVHYDRW